MDARDAGHWQCSKSPILPFLSQKADTSEKSVLSGGKKKLKEVSYWQLEGQWRMKLNPI